MKRVTYTVTLDDDANEDALRRAIANACETVAGAALSDGAEYSADTVCKIECTIDDMSAEGLALACDILMREGALDVCQIPAVMKKGRMGIKLEIVVRSTEREKFAALVFRHTSTIGIRVTDIGRMTLTRTVARENTPYGEVSIKTSSGYGTEKRKAEFDDIKAIIEKNNLM